MDRRVGFGPRLAASLVDLLIVGIVGFVAGRDRLAADWRLSAARRRGAAGAAGRVSEPCSRRAAWRVRVPTPVEAFTASPARWSDSRSASKTAAGRSLCRRWAISIHAPAARAVGLTCRLPGAGGGLVVSSAASSSSATAQALHDVGEDAVFGRPILFLRPGERWRQATHTDMGSGCALALWVVVMAATPAGQALRPPVAAGWQAYVAAAEARIMRERGQAIPRRPGVERGEIFIEEVSTPGPDGNRKVPDASVHHWRGTVLVPGAELEDVVSRLEREPPDTRQEDVVSSSILEQRPGWLRVAIRVRRSLLISAVFDTEHEVSFERHGERRASSWSTATKIVEVADAGTTNERPKRPDEARGLLWRWNAYWRYERIEQGVLVECESVTLSRAIPLVLRPVAGPIVGHVAHESMDRTLAVVRERFRPDRSR
jgi:hypothetical protein